MSGSTDRAIEVVPAAAPCEPVECGPGGSRNEPQKVHRLKPWTERLRCRLARETSEGRKFIPEIDGLRFIAIMGVLLYHLHDQARLTFPALTQWNEQAGWGFHLLQRGHFGVDLFFVISGFILALPFARYYLAKGRQVSLGGYYLRRLTRLEPTYLINLCLFFLALVVLRGDRVSELAGPLAASSTYTHNVVYGEMSRINFVAWSLEVEAQFYLLAPLLALMLAIPSTMARRTLWVVVAIVAGAISFCVDTVWAEAMPVTLLRFLPLFLSGFLLADLYVLRWSKSAGTSLIADVVFLMAFASIFIIPESSRLRFVATPVMALIVAGGLRGRIARWLVTRPWIVTIGGMCYTIYLYHFLVLTGVGRLTQSITVPGGIAANFALQVVLIVPAVLACSALLFVLFEKPFMRPGWYRSFLATAEAKQESHVC